MQNDSNNQNVWNAIFSLFFVVVCFVLFKILVSVRGSVPTSISFFDMSLLILAAFRITRLFVYDKITRFLRDMLFHVEEVYTEEGVTFFGKKERTRGPLRTAYDLLTCPWCFSVWAAVGVSFFYFLTPDAWLPIFVLAISGVASLLQLVANMIGWVAENGKIQASK